MVMTPRHCTRAGRATNSRHVTYTDGIGSESDPLRRAKIADDRLWTVPRGRIAIRDERDMAIRDALHIGVTPETIAATLSVRPDDVRRMAERAVERFGPAGRAGGRHGWGTGLWPAAPPAHTPSTAAV